VSTWDSLIELILDCEFCDTAESLLAVDEGIRFPDPLEYRRRIEMLFVSWAPPGTSLSIARHEFFHNPKASDKFRARIFNVLNQALPSAKLDPRDPFASLKRFYRIGFYLVPTIFRRIRDDATPRIDLVAHSASEHLLPIIGYLATYDEPLKIFLLGQTPIRAFAELFSSQLSGKKLADALRKSVAETRRLTHFAPLHFDLHGKRSLKIWVSNWPRGKGYTNLIHDVTNVLDWKNGTDLWHQ
jgi:hypothetical protein